LILTSAAERQETGDRRQETGDRRQETGDRRQETGDRGSEIVDSRWKIKAPPKERRYSDSPRQ
jgi:hypothetical protein